MIISDSSQVSQVDWEGGVLTIEFTRGGRYAYYDVPEGVYQELIYSPSKGRFIHDNIKGKFEYSKA